MKQSGRQKRQKPKAAPTGRRGRQDCFIQKAEKNPAFDVEWFYEEEEFFADHMDEYDW